MSSEQCRYHGRAERGWGDRGANFQASATRRDGERGLEGRRDDFLVAASGTDSQYDFMSFWNNNKNRLPTSYSVAMDVVLIQLSSACMERVFSILRGCWDSRQERVLGDLIESAVMVKCNRDQKNVRNATVGCG